MSSIRPLLTITVLAVVGVFLYAKINETEPPLPAGVDDWAVGTDIEFDMGGDMTAGAPSVGEMDAATAAPQFGTDGEAPAFAATAEAAPAFNGAEASTAPAWNPPPAASAAPPAEVAAAPTFDTSAADVATSEPAVPAMPDLPPMPSLPAAASTSSPQESPVSAAPDGLDNLVPDESQASTSPTTSESNAASASTPASNAAQAQSSLFSATRLAVQSALDRGELSQALLLLSDWYGDPSLSPSETAEVDMLLSQLAGSVIYSTEPRLEPPYMVQAGERLETIAKQYDVPWQLLAKINGITSADQLQPGQKIKVLRGPFSAVIDMSKKTLTLMLDRRYAGKFSLDIDSNVTVEAGHWEVKQKLLTPGNATLPGTGPTTISDERSLMLSSANGGTHQVAVLRGTSSNSPLAEPAGRILRLKPSDAEDVFDILSQGSKVVIRR